MTRARQLDLLARVQAGSQASGQAGGQAGGQERFTRPCHFSPCRNWRYTLERVWDFGNPRRVTWIGLNPSTADEIKNDPTVRRCIGFAQDWGFGGMFMMNLFAFRATKPADMKREADPVGPENDEALLWAAGQSELIVAAWGNHGTHLGRAASLMSLDFPVPLTALKLTKQGQPNHPLYLPKTSKPFLLE